MALCEQLGMYVIDDDREIETDLGLFFVFDCHFGFTSPPPSFFVLFSSFSA